MKDVLGILYSKEELDDFLFLSDFERQQRLIQRAKELIPVYEKGIAKIESGEMLTEAKEQLERLRQIVPKP